MERTTDQIETELSEVIADLRDLQKMPPFYTVHGNTIDNRERIAFLQRRKQELEAELTGRNVMQGPDIEV